MHMSKSLQRRCCSTIACSMPMSWQVYWSAYRRSWKVDSRNVQNSFELIYVILFDIPPKFEFDYFMIFYATPRLPEVHHAFWGSPRPKAGGLVGGPLQQAAPRRGSGVLSMWNTLYLGNLCGFWLVWYLRNLWETIFFLGGGSLNKSWFFYIFLESWLMIGLEYFISSSLGLSFSQLSYVQEGKGVLAIVQTELGEWTFHVQFYPN